MTELRKPLVALLFSPDQVVRKAILEGKKQITIRDGYREYHPGTPVVLCCCEKDPWCVQADITGVRYCRLAEVTEEEWQAAGFPSREEGLEGMRRFYPALTWDSAVTIIRWKNVRGKLVDDWAELRKSSWVLQDSDYWNRESSF